MSGPKFDRILKENFDSIFQPLLRRLLGVTLDTIENLSNELPVTLNRIPDILKRVGTRKGEKFIFHLEIQSGLDSRMCSRMLLYYSLLHFKFPKEEIRQFVLYLGRSREKMQNKYQSQGIEYEYNLINLNEWDYKTCVKSDVAEEVILGILCNFKGREKKEVINEILARLNALEADPQILEKYVNQLSVLAQLSKLDKLTLEEVRNMPIKLDITKNAFYKYATEMGVKAGREQGLQEGMAQGQDEERERIILTLLAKGLDVEKIARLLDLPIYVVRGIHLKALTPPN